MNYNQNEPEFWDNCYFFLVKYDVKRAPPIQSICHHVYMGEGFWKAGGYRRNVYVICFTKGLPFGLMFLIKIKKCFEM